MFKPCDLLLEDKTHSTESDEHIAEHVLPRKPCIILIVAAAMLHHDCRVVVVPLRMEQHLMPLTKVSFP